MFKKATQFLKEVKSEMSKVTWPTREELTSSTGVVIVTSLAFAVFIVLVDFILVSIMELIK